MKKGDTSTEYLVRCHYTYGRSEVKARYKTMEEAKQHYLRYPEIALSTGYRAEICGGSIQRVDTVVEDAFIVPDVDVPAKSEEVKP